MQNFLKPKWILVAAISFLNNPLLIEAQTPVPTPTTTVGPTLTPSPSTPSISLSSAPVVELTAPGKLSSSILTKGIASNLIKRVDYYLDSSLIASAVSAPFAITNYSVPYGIYKLSAKALLVSGESLTTPLSIVSVGRSGAFPLSPAAVSLPLVVTRSTSGLEVRWPKGSGNSVNFSRGKWNGFGIDSPTRKTLPSTSNSYVDNLATTPESSVYVYLAGHWVTGGGYRNGLVFAADKLTFPETRGGVLIIVDNTLAPNLTTELAALQQALKEEMWEPTMVTAPRSVIAPEATGSDTGAKRLAEVNAIRSLTRAFNARNPKKNKFAILIGHLPVPYSVPLGGAPDGHANHYGAWPTDLYYADVDGNWTDTDTFYNTTSFAANINKPGDGKFDQGEVPGIAWGKPSPLELAIGRIDFANMPGAGVSELELTRTYLQRDVDFRRGRYGQIGQKVLIDDNFGWFGMEAFAQSGYKMADQTFGFGSRLVSDWFTTLGQTSVLVASGCGGGTFTSASGVGTSTDFYTKPSMAVFNILFGSYFGDWNVKDNLLRASLASRHPNSLGLVSFWGARPGFTTNPLSFGEPVGKMLFAPDQRDLNFANATIQQAILGDPTLRLIHQPGVNGLSISKDAKGLAQASWTGADQNPVGYHVYGATSAEGPWTRLTGVGATTSDKGAIKDLKFSIPATYDYIRVYPLYLNSVPSGSYYSLGAATQVGPMSASY